MKNQKALHISTAPIPGSDETEIEMSYGERYLGCITVNVENFADFIEGLRSGFPLVINQLPKLPGRRLRI